MGQTTAPWEAESEGCSGPARRSSERADAGGTRRALWGRSFDGGAHPTSGPSGKRGSAGKEACDGEIQCLSVDLRGARAAALARGRANVMTKREYMKRWRRDHREEIRAAFHFQLARSRNKFLSPRIRSMFCLRYPKVRTTLPVSVSRHCGFIGSTDMSTPSFRSKNSYVYFG